MLTGTLQDWLDAHITGICITCESCGHHPLVPIWVLVSRLGPSATYEQIEAAMKCSKCGCKDVTAESMKEPGSALIWNKLAGA